MKQPKVLAHPAKTEEWQDRLRSFSMKTSFVVTLSKAMLESLCAVADGVQWDRSLYHGNIHWPDNWIGAERALGKRGLVRRMTDEEKVKKQGKHRTFLEFAEKVPRGELQWCVLTPAGECVVQLLKYAGLFVEADAAISKKSRRKA